MWTTWNKIMAAASYLEYDNIFEKCRNFLTPTLDYGNCLNVYRMALIHCWTKLIGKVEQFPSLSSSRLPWLDVHGNLVCSSVLVWVNQFSVSNISEEIGRGLIVFTSYTSPIKDQQQRFHHQDPDKKLSLVSSDWREGMISAMNESANVIVFF